MGAEHGEKTIETTPWSDCPLDIFSLGETDWAFKIYLPSFRRPFTEVGSVTVRCLPLCVNHPGFSCFGHFIRLFLAFLPSILSAGSFLLRSSLHQASSFPLLFLKPCPFF